MLLRPDLSWIQSINKGHISGADPMGAMRPGQRAEGDAIRNRIDRLDWAAIEKALWERGYAKTTALLGREECAGLVALYSQDTRFRSTIDMARFRFGLGEYRYFAYPLPDIVRE